ncbi:MAG TPA: hypothetical protein VJ912_01675 [Candidatus Nanoarchaeia archaeon]|nr:hypothetical protein [Candidatus Nanoarchaeia archaeon]
MEKEKKNEKKFYTLRINKETGMKIMFVLVLVALLVFAYFGFQNKIEQAYTNGYVNGYNKGISYGADSLAETQTKTGMIYFSSNNTIKNMTVTELCNLNLNTGNFSTPN